MLRKYLFIVFICLFSCDGNYAEHKVENRESVQESDFADAKTIRKNIRSFKAYDFVVSHNEIAISDYEGLSEILIQKNGKTLDSMIAPSGFLEIMVATELNEDIFLKDLDADSLPNLFLKEYTGEKACCYNFININLKKDTLQKDIFSGRHSEISVHTFDDKSFTLRLKDGNYIDLKAMPSVFIRFEGKKRLIDNELMKTQFVKMESFRVENQKQKTKNLLAYSEVLSWIYSGKADEALQILKEIWKDKPQVLEKLWGELKNRTLSGIYAEDIKKLNNW